MVNFREAEFGDMFKFVDTGETCVLIGKDDTAAFLRPVGYKGTMVYHVIFGCLLEKKYWEKHDPTPEEKLKNIYKVKKADC